MEITIGNKTYQLHFGWGFLKYVNKTKSVSFEGVQTGAGGMTILSAGLMMRDPEALETIIKAGTDTEHSKPSNDDIHAFIEQLIIDDKYDAFFDEVDSNLKKSVLLQKAMNSQNPVA